MAEEQKTEEGQAAEAAPKKKPSGLVLVLFAQTFVMLACAGLIVKTIVMAKKPDLSPKALQESAIKSVRDEEVAIKVMDLEDFVVNISKTYILRTKIQVEVSNDDVVQKLTARKPAIRARILGLLSTQEAKASGKIQAKLLLKDAIREAINEELFENVHAEIRAPASQGHAPSGTQGVVREVYLVDFVLSRG